MLNVYSMYSAFSEYNLTSWIKVNVHDVWSYHRHDKYRCTKTHGAIDQVTVYMHCLIFKQWLQCVFWTYM